MSEMWMKVDLSCWADIAAALQLTGNEWPKSAVLTDLRWYGMIGREISRREAMIRWKWSERKARNVIAEHCENENKVPGRSQEGPKNDAQDIEITDAKVPARSQEGPKKKTTPYIIRDLDKDIIYTAEEKSQKEQLSIEDCLHEGPKNAKSKKKRTANEEVLFVYQAFLEINSRWRKQNSKEASKFSLTPSARQIGQIGFFLTERGYSKEDLVNYFNFMHFSPSQRWWQQGNHLSVDKLMAQKRDSDIQTALDAKFESSSQTAKQEDVIRLRAQRLLDLLPKIPNRPGEGISSVAELDEIDRMVVMKFDGLKPLQKIIRDDRQKKWNDKSLDELIFSYYKNAMQNEVENVGIR